MVHGDCSSRGCYAMTDEQIQEIYALARESFFGGQKEFQFEAFPFRMTALNMAKHRNNPNFAFWKMLKEGYDDFEATHQEPKVAVCEKRYVFDAAPPENASQAAQRSIRAASARSTGSTRRSPTRCSIIAGKSNSRWPNISPRRRHGAAAWRRRRHEPGIRRQARPPERYIDNNGRIYQVAGNSRRPARCRARPIRRAAADRRAAAARRRGRASPW